MAEWLLVLLVLLIGIPVGVVILYVVHRRQDSVLQTRYIQRAIDALNDENPDVRTRAAIVLQQEKDPRAVKPLILALKDYNKLVRVSAELALRETTGRDFGQDTAAWQHWWEQNEKNISKGR